MNEKTNPIRTEYLAHIEKQKTSELSIKKYCVKNNLVEHKFLYYRDYNLKNKEKPHAFARVELKNHSSSSNVDKYSEAKIDPI